MRAMEKTKGDKTFWENHIIKKNCEVISEFKMVMFILLVSIET